MFGIWIIILFVILPAAAGFALTYAFSKQESPPVKHLAFGAAGGAGVGVIAAILLTQL